MSVSAFVKDEINPAFSDKEKVESHITSLAERILDPDCGMLILAVALGSIDAIEEQLGKQAIAHAIWNAPRFTKTNELALPVEPVFRELLAGYSDKDLISTLEMTTNSNMLSSSIFWSVREQVPLFGALRQTMGLYSDWLLRDVLDIDRKQPLTVELLTNFATSSELISGEVSPERFMRIIEGSLPNTTTFDVMRAAFQSGAEDVNFPKFDDMIEAGKLSPLDKKIFLAKKLETMWLLLLAKLQILGFDTQNDQDVGEIGMQVFGDIQPFEHLPKISDIWGLIVDLISSIRQQLELEWLPAWEDEHGIFDSEPSLKPKR